MSDEQKPTKTTETETERHMVDETETETVEQPVDGDAVDNDESAE